MGSRSRSPKIFIRKLGKLPPGRPGTVYGMIAEDGNVYVDARQSPSEMLDTIVHEMVHIACPHMSELSVRKLSQTVSAALWKKGYRKQK